MTLIGKDRLDPHNIESFINDHLREDLKTYEQHLNRLNGDIMEYVQLKNMIENLQDNTKGGFKTQVNIGGNFFMKAKAEKVDKILVDIGLKHYLEFTLEEALKFVDMKIKILTKQSDVIRDQSVQTRANIKLALLVIGDTNQLYANAER
ncbi:protein UXT [Toxorhynchites rutilus septentrionalis]|uniref:protein UXT n=1 Tax=Toxorhynchites rutilus septentrionalis TaxID=329112 RepID=UPI00247AC5D9|nr:protein UXT [Toxorhynchites rutilus septentrionalis]